MTTSKSVLGKSRLFVFAFLAFAGIFCIQACNSEPDNPFDNTEEPTGEDSTSLQLNPVSIEGIHESVFKPTCANSGCHDGTFEPDFRTIYSSYNTLVYHPIIKNDPGGSYTYRVVPGNASQSVLSARLNFDIDGNSGIMPLVVEPDSDWPDKSAEYIANINAWIQDGAKDMFGNTPSLTNGLPQMLGVAGNSGGWLLRGDGGNGELIVPQGQNSVDLYFAFQDDTTPSSGLTYNKIKYSTNPDDFSASAELDLALLGSPITQAGFQGEQVAYTHVATVDPTTLGGTGSQVFFRTYVQDNANPVTEIPTTAGASYIKSYFSFQIEQ